MHHGLTACPLIRASELQPGLGRKGRYIDFLMVLCECNSKAVRPNQWRIAELLFTPVRELLRVSLSLGVSACVADHLHASRATCREG